MDRTLLDHTSDQVAVRCKGCGVMARIDDQWKKVAMGPRGICEGREDVR